MLAPKQRAALPSWLLVAASGIGGVGLMELLTRHDADGLRDIAGLLGLRVALTVIMLAGVFPRPARIVLLRIHEDEPWYKRHQGDIIRGTITGLIGTVFGYLLGMLQGH